MSKPLRKYGIISLWVLGLIPTLLQLEWAQTMIVLWLVLMVVSYKHTTINRHILYHGILILLCSASLWGVGKLVLPYCPSFIIIILWLFVIGFIFEDLIRKRDDPNKLFVTITHPSSTLLIPSKAITSFALMILVGGWLLLHWGLNYYLGKVFLWSWWMTPSWGVFCFLLFYPSKFGEEFHRSEQNLFSLVCTLMIIVAVAGHSIQYWYLSQQLQNDSPQKERIEHAFERGYESLGIVGSIQQVQEYAQQAQWDKAVQVLRSYWHYTKKADFVYQWFETPALKENLFLFTMTFGCRLQLTEGEEAVDFSVLPDQNQILLLTSTGRLLSLGENGVNLDSALPEGISESPKRMDVGKTYQQRAVLTQDGHVYVQRGNDYVSPLSLPQTRTWNNTRWDNLIWSDLNLSEDRETLWVLDDHGTIDQYGYNPNTNQWILEQEALHPPLWKESNMGQALLPVKNGKAFLTLDVYGGVHWRGDSNLQPVHFTQKNLNKYYNSNRPVMHDMAFWRNPSELILLNIYGRLDFITSLPHTDLEKSEDLTYDELVLDAIPSVREILYYDHASSQKYYAAHATAIESVPEIETIMQLGKNGTVMPILMPQGYRITFDEGENVIHLPASD